jgi:hypothetical protein
MYTVLYEIVCSGDTFRRKHVVFHLDNEAVHRP